MSYMNNYQQTGGLPQSMSLSHMQNAFVTQCESMYGRPHPSRHEAVSAGRIVVKVGTSVVSRSVDGRLALGRLGALVEQLEALVRSGRQVILVSSGSVGVGRQRLRHQQVMNRSPLEMHLGGGTTEAKSRAAAAAGQSGLMSLYDNLFNLMDVMCAQFLVTTADFQQTGFRQQLRETVDQLVDVGVVPVFNENDAISVHQLTEKDTSADAPPFWDNDSLAALLADVLKADLLVLCTDVDALYTGPPSEPGSKIIHTFCPEIHMPMLKFGQKSTGGRGGMLAKIDAAWECATKACPVVIANGKALDIVLRVVAGQQIGTLVSVDAARVFAKEAEYGQHADTEHQSSSDVAKAARAAGERLQALSEAERSRILEAIADALIEAEAEIIVENNADMAGSHGRVTDTLMQQLFLKPGRIREVAQAVRAIAAGEARVGEVLDRRTLEDGVTLEKVSAPVGVVLAVVEAHPEWLPVVTAMAIKAGSAVVIKGGKEASRSNAIVHKTMAAVLEGTAPGSALVSFVGATEELDGVLALDNIDLVIPHGTPEFVAFTRRVSKAPVLGAAEGVCNIYVDASVDMAQAIDVCVDAKTDKSDAENAVDKVLVHRALVDDGRILQLTSAMVKAGVRVNGGEEATRVLGLPPAPSARVDYRAREMTLEVVDSLEGAIAHINEFGSGHTDCILTNNEETATAFKKAVQSACVFWNASTRLADAGYFGFGSEACFSDSKLHARGPVTVPNLMTYKWVVSGNGKCAATALSKN
ncbi:unnamed protein product [Pedinophyceae sp. YPF-701]|nr:unnamed protein product [Pedinophyceae sp. YPF-701]